MSLFDLQPPPLPTPPPIPEPPAAPFSWTDEQQRALDEIATWRRTSAPFYALTGPAGAGKTTVVREIVARHPEARLTAMTGKAALRMSECADRDAVTLHSILYFPPKPGEDVRFTKLRDPESYLVLVDEASMTSPGVFADMKRWTERGVRFLLIGDPYQLPPVITGEDLKRYGEDFSVFSEVKGAHLKTVMRNAGGILRAATKVRETGEICRASDLDGPQQGYEFVRHRSSLERAVDDYCNDRDGHMLVTWKNANRMKANRMIRERLGHEGPIPDDGEPVLLRKNGQGFLNGEIVLCGGFEAGPDIGSLKTLWMKVQDDVLNRRILISYEGTEEEKGGEIFDGGLPWIASWGKYQNDLRTKGLPEPIPATFGHCLTAHAAQGGEARRVTVFLCGGDETNRNFRKPTTLPDGSNTPFSARFLYTATTRGRKHVSMIIP